MAATTETGRTTNKGQAKKPDARSNATATAKRDAQTGRVKASTSKAGSGVVRNRDGRTAVARSPSPRVGGSVDWKAAERAEFLIDTLGGVTKLAEALGVSKSQPGRWRSGEERPGAAAARSLLDLDHVMGRAIQVWTPEVAARWMRSSNAHLGGATPIDVLVSRGPSDVVSALDATMSGAFA